MNLIIVNSIKLKWIENTLSDKIIDNPIVLREIRKPFKLGEIKTVIFNENKKVSYTIYKASSRSNDYELLENGKIKIFNNFTDELKFSTDSLEFQTNVFTKIILDKAVNDSIHLFGLEEIESKVHFNLNSKEFSVIVLHGPIHSGKVSLLKKIEKDYEHKHFLWIDCNLLKVNTGHIEEIILFVRAFQRNVILCVTNVQKLELNDSLRLRKMLEEYNKNRKFGIKVIMSCSDIALLSPEIDALIHVKIGVPGINKNDRLKILQQLICSKTGRNKFEEGLDIFAATLNGYTAYDIKEFIKLSILKDPTLSLKQLQINKKNKIYNPKQLMNLEADVDSLRWSEIGGYDYVKNLLIENVQEPILSDGKISKGILLHGPPGCSKTMFARALATECDLNMFIVKPSNILCSLVGESEAKLRNILQIATISAPSIIFFDEIDTLLPKKDIKNDTPVTKRLLNELLVFLDGIETKKDQRVIFMAATNILNLVDDALKRSGRIDQIIEVNLPDQNSIESILRISFSDEKYKVDDEVILNIPAMAKVFYQKSGAEIVHAVRQMKKCCFKEFERNNMNSSLPYLTMRYVTDIIGVLEEPLSSLLQSLSL